MRILVVAASFFALGSTLSAQQQHLTASASHPPVVVHSAPVAPAPQIHVAPIHTPAPVHSVVSSNGPSTVKPVVPHRRTLPPPVGSAGNPGVGSSGSSHCNKHFSYPIQGLSACPPPATPIYGGAYFIPVPYYYPDTTVQDQELPQSDVEQVVAEGSSTDQSEPNSQESELDRSESAAEPHTRSASNNINDSLAEFVFIQRDGSKLFAVAYSFLNDKLHYVTKEGVRHSLALDSLDLEATQKSNEQLGTTINLPNLPPSGVAFNISPTALQ